MRRIFAAAILLMGIRSALGQVQTMALPRAGRPGQETREAITGEQVAASIDKLGAFEYPVRTAAARTIRRAPSAIAVPALLKAVSGHSDRYVRFRGLVLLSGFNDARTRDVMLKSLDERDDRMRAVAYSYFEHNRDAVVLPKLLKAVETESSEFVRPALTRALAAYGADAQARETMRGLIMKGHAAFRSSVIEALGDYHAAYAVAPLTEVAKIDGPLQDDAALALGKIGDKSTLPTLASLQRTAPRESQPSIAAAICLLGVNCDSHKRYLVETVRFAIANVGFQELLRAAAGGLAALAVSGQADACVVLIEQGAPTRDPARAAIALALGTIALRNAPLVLEILQRESMLEPGSALLRDAFDMFEEDFEEERFFVAVRRAYWQAPVGPGARKVAETLIQALDF